MFKPPKLIVGVGVAVLLAVVLVVLGDRSYKNDWVNAIVERLDSTDAKCREAVVALGSECPNGCVIRPPKGPEELHQVPECRSRLWVATCSTDCQTRKGLVRLPDGEFVDSSSLIIRMSGPANSFASDFEVLGIELENGISGLYRYRARFDNIDDSLSKLQTMKDRLSRMTGVLEVKYSQK